MGPALLAQLGAEVIRCEILQWGIPRARLIRLAGFSRTRARCCWHINQNKYWVGLDLHKPEGQKIFCELAAQCDIVENNFRPGVMEDWA